MRNACNHIVYNPATVLNRYSFRLESIIQVLKKHYTKGKSATGKPSYSGLLLFKMSLLQTWYGLSDYEVEDRVNDSISFSYFCGLSIDQIAPDHSTLSHFRSILTKAKATSLCLKKLIGN